MNILVTGGSGFIGSSLVQTLENMNFGKVFIFGRGGSERQNTIIGDIRSEKSINESISQIKPDWVFHLAANSRRYGDQGEDEMFKVNVSGTENMLRAACDVGVKMFVSVGSFEEYGSVKTPFKENQEINPQSNYGRTKAEATEKVLSYSSKIPAAVVRFPIVYGPNPRKDSFIGVLVEKISSMEQVPLGTGEETRDFLHISDAVSGLIAVAENIDICRGRIINICSGTATRLIDAVSLAEEIVGREGIAKIGVFPDRPGSQKDYVGSRDLAKELIGWEPKISLKEGLSDILKQYKKSG